MAAFFYRIVSYCLKSFAASYCKTEPFTFPNNGAPNP